MGDLNAQRFRLVIYWIHSMKKLARQAGVLDNEPKFENIMESFGIEPKWLRNAGNDTVYCLVLTLLLGLFPILYPDTPSGFPLDSSLNGLSLNNIPDQFSQWCKQQPSPTLGNALFCFYCEIADDHPADICPNKDLQVCHLCAGAPGKKNYQYRKKPRGIGRVAASSSTGTTSGRCRSG